MAAGPKSSFVALILISCSAVAVCRMLQAAPATQPVELHFRELVRVHGGQSVAVLEEIGGNRRLPVPVSKAQAAMIERGLRGPGGLLPQSLGAVGSRVLRASIDQFSPERGFRGHVSVGSGARSVDVESPAGDALAAALQSGAPIVVDRDLLDAAGVSPEDLHGRKARNVTKDPSPAPVLHI